MPRTAPPPNQYETAVMGSLPPPPGLYDDDGAPPAPQEEYLLSLDAGTSSIKAAVIEVRNSGERRVVSFSIESLPPPAAVAGIAGSSEQNAEAWWAAATRAIQRAVAAQPVQAVALSGQMQSVVLLDGAGAPLRPALLYSDTRATAEAAALVASLGVERLRAEAINWKGAASTLPKLLWLLAHEADAVGGAAAVALSAHDFLYRRLTGVGATDPTNASTTGLLAAGREDGWAAPLLADAGVPAALVAKLPPVRRGARLLAPLSAAAAAALGGALAEGTPVCLGAGDLGTTTVGALGSGGGRAVGAPSTYCYLGTSGWVATVGDANPEADDDDDDIDCFEVVHPLPGRRILAAPMTTAGGNVRWLCGLLWPELPDADALARVEAEAAAAPAGCNGLLYLPYLSGERCPVDDPHARACFVGMGAGTNRGAMCRAVLEGICFAVRSLLPLLPEEPAAFVAHDDAVAELQAQIATAEALRRQGPVGTGALRAGSFSFSFGEGDAAVDEAPPPLVLVGGVANSRVLAAALASVLQREVRVPRDPAHVPALGAAALAAAAIAAAVSEGEGGGGGEVEGAAEAECFAPDPRLRAVYDDAYERWCTVHPALSETFARAARAPAK